MSKRKHRSRERPPALADEPRESKRGSAHKARQKAREEWLRSGGAGFPKEGATPRCDVGGGETKRGVHKGDAGADVPRKVPKAADGGPLRLGSSTKPFEADGATVSEVPWLSTGLRVRIIDEVGPFSEYFLKKCLVRKVDAVSLTAHVDVDGGLTLKSVPQKALETIVSKGCEKVEVVRGQHRGMVVTLLERDAKNNVAVVASRRDDRDSRLELALDDICEFKQ